MWIGLFLLTPFLNKLWNSLNDKRPRIILIIILFACSAFPDFTNRYGLSIVPDYWRSTTYPLMCFFIGCYIRSYQPLFNSQLLIGIITALCLLNPIISIIIAPGRPMMHLHGGPGGIISIPVAVLTFLLFYQKDIKFTPVRNLITKISLLSLNMYLTAYIFDQLLYPVWTEYAGETQQELAPFYPAIIFSLVAGTFITSYLDDLIKNIFTYKSSGTQITTQLNI